MSPRFLYLATADARGHLMRAQLLVHALRSAGATVEVLTTSVQGQRFLQPFGIQAQLLSTAYAVQFDGAQNMLRNATNRNVALYLLRPGCLLRDMAFLHRRLREVDLVINDSFHPALVQMGMLPGWRHKVVHVYGASLRDALINNFAGVGPRLLGRLFGAIVARQLQRARARIEHDFAYTVDAAQAPDVYRLPTPVALAAARPAIFDNSVSDDDRSVAAVYLNPHFRDPALADELSAGLADAGLRAHRVGEGYAGRTGWLGVDPYWAEHAAYAPLLVSAPGMAALSIARVYQRPIILILSDQPEQVSNAARARTLGLRHQVVRWEGDAAEFRHQMAAAAVQLCGVPLSDPTAETGRQRAQARVDAWVSRLLSLAER